MTETAQIPPISSDPMDTYVGMLDEYLGKPENRVWIAAPSLAPLVFHLRKVCGQLDQAGATAPAALSSAYLKAFGALDARRPDGVGGPASNPAEVGQSSIFDELG